MIRYAVVECAQWEDLSAEERKRLTEKTRVERGVSAEQYWEIMDELKADKDQYYILSSLEKIAEEELGGAK
jgi:hypothetical protein